MYDVQKPSMWKRISAALFDLILLLVVITGAALLISVILGYDAHSTRMNGIYERYKQEYGLNISQEEYDAFTDEERQAYKDAYEKANQAISKDDEAAYLYMLLFNYTLIIITFSILIGYLLMELLIPLLLRNGQTLGKKIFGIGVMRVDGVKISPLQMVVRTVLGKFAVETMIPVFAILMIFYNIAGIVSIVVLAILGLAQLILIISDWMRTPIHDKMAATVTVDIASQMIFESPEALLAYKQRIHAESVEKSTEYGAKESE